MRIELEKRAERSRLMALVSPLIAILLTVVSAAVIFSLYGKAPGDALYVYFVKPLTSLRTAQELVVRATPLVLMGVGLSLCYVSNNWNIGAEGQYIIGATVGGGIALLFQGQTPFYAVPLIMVGGMVGGALWGLIPGLLKTRFNTNEILTSLMLVYIAERIIDYFVRGPWRDPAGLNFPLTANFDNTLPTLFRRSPIHLDSIFAVLVVIAAAILLWRSLKGFEIRVLGEAPRAGLFAGFSPQRTTLVVFAVSGALAGLAGVSVADGTMGMLQIPFASGYGFTAIIVAFLGRLNPVGILLAGLLLALSYLGGEAAQISLKVPIGITSVIQGLLLFYVLACDTLILYRLRVTRSEAKVV
ncbi:ABC transporter permease [Labrys monachus]|uniref:Simple sugar transport system permease protein n=1 Tax=Labrys monachus TaxID=217067 RepID=A0ABU0FF01_9HYPH|nr:ABC transporter permease [Labrys monachus]MDQ0393193.1 simple sugar transport system permease protein [Labrys monachus]